MCSWSPWGFCFSSLPTEASRACRCVGTVLALFWPPGPPGARSAGSVGLLIVGLAPEPSGTTGRSPARPAGLRKAAVGVLPADPGTSRAGLAR